MFSTADTIVGIARPPGRGGIGVVRLSGPASHEIAATLTGERRSFQPRHATLVILRDAAQGSNQNGAIDQAIVESRAALTNDPESQPARESLFEALRRKVGVLQATVTLMNEMRQGNQAGAAEAAAGLNKKG